MRKYAITNLANRVSRNIKDQLKSRSEKRGELAMPAFRVEGDATAPLRGFAFLKKKIINNSKSIKKQNFEK